MNVIQELTDTIVNQLPPEHQPEWEDRFNQMPRPEEGSDLFHILPNRYLGCLLYNVQAIVPEGYREPFDITHEYFLRSGLYTIDPDKFERTRMAFLLAEEVFRNTVGEARPVDEVMLALFAATWRENKPLDVFKALVQVVKHFTEQDVLEGWLLTCAEAWETFSWEGRGSE